MRLAQSSSFWVHCIRVVCFLPLLCAVHSSYSQPPILKQGDIGHAHVNLETAVHPEFGPIVCVDDSTYAHGGGVGGGSSLKIRLIPWLDPDQSAVVDFPPELHGDVLQYPYPQKSVWVPCDLANYTPPCKTLEYCPPRRICLDVSNPDYVLAAVLTEYRQVLTSDFVVRVYLIAYWPETNTASAPYMALERLSPDSISDVSLFSIGGAPYLAWLESYQQHPVGNQWHRFQKLYVRGAFGGVEQSVVVASGQNLAAHPSIHPRMHARSDVGVPSGRTVFAVDSWISETQHGVKVLEMAGTALPSAPVRSIPNAANPVVDTCPWTPALDYAVGYERHPFAGFAYPIGIGLSEYSSVANPQWADYVATEAPSSRRPSLVCTQSASPEEHDTVLVWQSHPTESGEVLLAHRRSGPEPEFESEIIVARGDNRGIPHPSLTPAARIPSLAALSPPVWTGDETSYNGTFYLSWAAQNAPSFSLFGKRSDDAPFVSDYVYPSFGWTNLIGPNGAGPFTRYLGGSTSCSDGLAFGLDAHQGMLEFNLGQWTPESQVYKTKLKYVLWSDTTVDGGACSVTSTLVEDYLDNDISDDPVLEVTDIAAWECSSEAGVDVQCDVSAYGWDYWNWNPKPSEFIGFFVSSVPSGWAWVGVLDGALEMKKIVWAP